MNNALEKAVIVWFRQDLRLHDQPALNSAVESGYPIIPLYIYDNSDKETRALGGAQQWWLYHSLTALMSDLEKRGLQLILKYGKPLDKLHEIINNYDIQGVYWSRCYEPYAITRDIVIKQSLKDRGIEVHSVNSSLLFEPWTILNQVEQPYKVFSQFWKSCLKQLDRTSQLNHSLPAKFKAVIKSPTSDDLADWKLLPTAPNWAKEFAEHWIPGEAGAHDHLEAFIEDIAENYRSERNYPGREGTSRLSPHLHFGEISPHQILRALMAHYPTGLTAGPECYLKELGWREFCYYLLYHYPHMVDKPFRADFDAVGWDYDDKMMQQWQHGLTGFPIVDAGLRQLWRMGWMHNRVRMIVASFLTKDLFMDWKDGERWFWDTLVDADLASNVAGWQWVAGCGADAAPYFRVFNPYLQSKKLEQYLDGENYIETVWGRGYVLREPSKDDGMNNYVKSPSVQPSISSPRPPKPQAPTSSKPTMGQHRPSTSPTKTTQSSLQKPVIGQQRPLQSPSSSSIQPQIQQAASRPAMGNPYRPSSASLSQSMPSNMQKPIVGVQRPASSMAQSPQIRPVNTDQKVSSQSPQGQQQRPATQSSQSLQQSNVQPAPIKRATS